MNGRLRELVALCPIEYAGSFINSHNCSVRIVEQHCPKLLDTVSSFLLQQTIHKESTKTKTGEKITNRKKRILYK